MRQIIKKSIGALAAGCVLTFSAGAQPVPGTYSGLFFDTNQVAQLSSGSLTMKITAGGAFSGSVQLGGSRGSFSGAFSGNQASQILRLPNHEPLNLDLEFAGPDQLRGILSNGTWRSEVMGNRAGFDGQTKVALQAGRYTLILPGVYGSTLQPAGDGYGTVLVDKAGRIKLSASMADGTKLSQSATLSGNGLWPLYAPLYAGQGMALSWITFTNLPDSDLSGEFIWTKPGMPKAQYYPGGWTSKTRLQGSAYAQPASGTPPLNFMSGTVVIEGGNLSNPITNHVLLDDKGRLRNLSSDRFSMVFTPATGLFRGSVTDPAAAKLISISGVVLQAGNLAAGYFRGLNQFGRVRLEAAPGDIVSFQTKGDAFAPEVQYDGVMEGFRWLWSDNTFSTDYPIANKHFTPTHAQFQYLSAFPPGRLSAINLGFDASDGGASTPLTNRPQQNVSSVEFPYPLTGLRFWASSYNPITNTLDFTGFSALEAIECFHCTNLEHVAVANLPSLKRVCFENCDLQELDLSGDPNLADVRAAINSFTSVTIGGGTGPKIWHWCIRENPQLTQDLHLIMTNFYSLQELWTWHDNQSGALTVVSTNLTDVEVEGNHYSYADLSGQPNLQTCWIYGNQLTNLVMTGCVGLQDLDASGNQLPSPVLDSLLTLLDTSCPDLHTVNLTRNLEFPSALGYNHYTNLTNRGVVVYVDGR